MSSNKSESLKNGWFKLRFEQIAENIVDHVEIPRESGYERFVGGDHLDSECLSIKRWGSTNDVDAQKLLFKKGHILFGKRNAYLRKVAYADFDGVCSAHMMVLKSRPEFIEERFFPFFMQTDQFWERADMISEGSMSPTIKWKTLAQQKFIIPPKDEQRRIADILWAAEDCIVKKEKLVDETESYKKTLMIKLLTTGIEHKKFKNTGIGKIPEEWDIVKCENLCEIITVGIVIKPASSYVSKGIPALRSLNIREDRIDLQDLVFISEKDNNSKFLKSRLKEGDVVIVRTGYPGTSCVVSKELEGVNCIDLVIARPNKKIIQSQFLSRYFNSQGGKKQTLAAQTGLAQKHFNIGEVKKVLVPLPPLPEQQRIIEILSKLDNAIQKTKENILKAKALKMVLINQFLTGGLRAAFLDNPQDKRVIYETQVSE